MSEDKQHPEFSLLALQSGDPAEFTRFVDSYSGMVYRMALKMLNNAQDAEDVLQETFIKAYKHIREFEGRSRLSTWLYRIAVNEALMFLRRGTGNTISLDENIQMDEGEPEPRQIVDWCCLPEEELLSSETRQRLNESIQLLSPALRVVFLLRDVEGLSIKETSEVLGLNESAVKIRLLRARLHLRELLTGYFNERVVKK